MNHHIRPPSRFSALFEFVVVAVGVVGAVGVVVFVDENTVLVGETFPAVLAAATPKGEQEKQPGG